MLFLYSYAVEIMALKGLFYKVIQYKTLIYPSVVSKMSFVNGQNIKF